MNEKMIALEVMYVFQGRGIEPGSFTTSLIKAISQADAENKRKLAIVYPEYVSLVSKYFENDDSYNELVSLAGFES